MKRFTEKKVTECCGGANMGGIKSIKLIPMDQYFNIEFDPETIKDLESDFFRSSASIINSAIGSPSLFRGFSIEQRVKENPFVLTGVPEQLSRLKEIERYSLMYGYWGIEPVNLRSIRDYYILNNKNLRIN